MSENKNGILILVMLLLSILAGAMVYWEDDSKNSFHVSQTNEDIRTWRRLPDMSHKAADCTAVVIGDKIIVIGGYHPTADTPLNYTQIYNSSYKW